MFPGGSPDQVCLHAFGGIKATDNSTDICCFTTLTGSMGGDFTMALGDSAGYSYQNITLHSFISSSSFLHNAQTILFLFLSHLSTPHLHVIMAPASGRPCSRLAWVSSACLFHMTCFFLKEFRIIVFSHTSLVILSFPSAPSFNHSCSVFPPKPKVLCSISFSS